MTKYINVNDPLIQVQRQYPNLLERFLNFGGFEDIWVWKKKLPNSVNLKSRTSEFGI
jgi:hypothetical protein